MNSPPPPTPQALPQPPQVQLGGKPTLFTPLMNGLAYLNEKVMYMNNSKFFAGVVMILLNIGSKFIQIQFSKSTEEYMKYSVSKQLLVFAMAYIGSRDIYIALGLTAIFTILSDHLFNEESRFCIVPEKCRVLNKMIPEDMPPVSDLELASAISILERAKREKQRMQQRDLFAKFDFQKYNLE